VTKKELKKLIRTCLYEVYLNIDEGAILNVQDTAEKIVKKFKKFYIDSEDTLAKQNPFDDEYEKESINKLGEWINSNFFFKLKIASLPRDKQETTTDTPIPILFDELNTGVAGVYRSSLTKKASEGIIILNSIVYLATKVKDSDKYKLIPPTKIDYDELSDTIEHELMHYEQHFRSGKQGSVFFGNKNNDPEVKQMLANKQNKPENLSDEEYEKNVNYYNKKIELNTHAKDIANNYANEWYKIAKKSERTFTSEQMKIIITSAFTNPQSDKNKDSVTARRDGTNMLMNLFSGYKYLTPKNRNKWWKYVHASLLGMNYKGVNEPPPLPSQQNENIKCPKCGTLNKSDSRYCLNCGTQLRGLT